MGNNQSSVDTFSTFDPVRYQGEWFEIARLPNPFEIICEENQPRANYRWDAKRKKLLVNNICQDNDGNESTINGIGRIVDPNYPGKLIVTFDPGFTGQYWIYWTDYSNFAIVGDQSKTFYWILSRTDTISREMFQLLTSYSQSIGFNLKSLIVIPNAIAG